MAGVRTVSLVTHYAHNMPSSSLWGFPLTDKWNAIVTVMLYGTIPFPNSRG